MMGDIEPAMSPLEDERFVSLVTFRRDGEPVATPVWFAGTDTGFVVGTHQDSGKVRRILANPAIRFAACNFRGLERAAYRDGTAVVVTGGQTEAAEEALVEKYGWQWRAFGRTIDCFLSIDRR